MGIKILLADDSVTAQNMGKKILSEAGHEVVTVSNGAAAAKKIAEVKPELVLLDVFMPGYSGLELCEKLRSAASTAKLPVLLTVGRMEPYNAQDGARVKADGVIVKPFEATDLTAAVDRIAEKIKPGKPNSTKEYEPTVKIAPPVGAIGETTSPKPADYQPTMRLDSAQIAAMLNRGASVEKESEKESVPAAAAVQNEIPAATPALPAEEFHVAPASAPRVIEDLPTAAIPAFGSELEVGTSAPPAVPSYMAQYLADNPAFKIEPVPVEPERPAVPEASVLEVMKPEAPAVDEFAQTIAINKNDLVQHFDTSLSTPADTPIASAQGLELTAAAPVGDVQIVHDAGFEPTLQSSETPAFIAPDPAFESDLHRSAMEFPTHFGITETPASDLPLPTENTPAAADDFEARLSAALSAFEEPASDLPLPSFPSPSESQPAELNPSTSEGFESRLEAAMHAFDTAGEPAVELPSHALAEVHASEPEVTFEPQSAAIEPIAEPQYNPTTPETAVLDPYVEPEPTAVHAVSEVVVTPVQSEAHAHAPETDDSVIEQMRDSFSELPVEAAHPAEASEPMAMAAAAAVGPVAVPTHHEAEAELARALAAVVGGAEAHIQPASSAEGAEAATSADANKVAAAVERVMQRELPSLIWKIMAELDLKKRD